MEVARYLQLSNNLSAIGKAQVENIGTPKRLKTAFMSEQM